MKKENSVPVKPVGGGVNCQDACGWEEAESTNPVGRGWVRGRGCHSAPPVLSSFCGMHRSLHSVRHHIFSSHLVLSSLCISHSPQLLREALDCPVLESPPKARGHPQWTWASSYQCCWGWQGWFSFSMFGQASPFLQICLKPLSKGVYLPARRTPKTHGFKKKKKLIGFFSGLTTCLNSDPFKRDWLELKVNDTFF